jgi:hypothetical protein
MSDTNLAKNDDLIFTVSMYCGAELQSAFMVYSDLMCVQPTKKNKWCGEEFATANATMQLVSSFLKNKEGSMDQALLKQSTLNSLCSECFDLILIGAYTLFGDLQADTNSDSCDEACDKNKEETADSLSALAAASVLCIPNDNTAQKATDPWCFPYVYNNLRTIGQGCASTKTAKDCHSQNGECAWFMNACHPTYEVPVTQTGEAQLPPFKLLDKFCSNNCFNLVQFAMIDAGATIADNNDLSNAGGDKRRRRHRKMRSQQTSGSGSGATEAIDQNEFNAATDDLEAVATFICLSNTKGTCMGQYQTLTTPAGCQNDMQTWNSAKPTCGGAGCAASIKAQLDSLGCCMGVFSELQMATDPKYEEFSNFAGVITACNLTVPASCDPYSSTPVPVTTKVSGSCDWIKANASNLEVLKNGTAKALGVSPASLQGFAVKNSDGSSCSATKPSARHHRVRTLQAQAALSANFAVVARDNETAARIAANANSKPVTIPTVQKAATTTAETAKNTALAQTAPTVAPKATPATTPKATANATNTNAPTIAPRSGASALTVSAALMAVLIVILAL